MTFRVWVRFIAGAMNKEKGRSLLTLLGIVVGAATLAFSLALAIGLRAMITREFQSRSTFWEIHVIPRYQVKELTEADIPPEKLKLPDNVTGERRNRLKQSLIEQYRFQEARSLPKAITSTTIEEFKQLPGVTEVLASYTRHGTVELQDHKHSASLIACSLPTLELEPLVVMGKVPTEPNSTGVVIREFTLYNLGYENDADFEKCLGKPLTVILGKAESGQSFSAAMALGLNISKTTKAEEQLLDKLAKSLPKIVQEANLTPIEQLLLAKMFADKTRQGEEKAKGTETVRGTFHIAAIIRDRTAEEQKKQLNRLRYFNTNADVYLPEVSGRMLFEQFPEVRDYGHHSVVVKIKPGGDLRALTTQIEANGYQAHSALEWYDSVMMEVTMIGGGLNLFAMIAIFVAGLGITNTLATSVVERTREIGMLRATGATRGQVLWLFLGEGVALGLLGGVLGVLLAIGLSYPGDRLVSKLVETQSQGRLKAATIFEFPLYILAGTLAFTLCSTTLAAYLPARRAARMLPVEALRAL